MIIGVNGSWMEAPLHFPSYNDSVKAFIYFYILPADCLTSGNIRFEFYMMSKTDR